MGLAIHSNNRRRVPDALENALEATYWGSLDQMLARMDIISVNCPHKPAIFRLLSGRRLKLLRRQAIVVNTSRGEGWRSLGLITGSCSNTSRPAPAISRECSIRVNAGSSITLDNVVLLPHMTSATIEGRLDMGEKVLINIKTFVDGHRSPDRVLPSQS